MTHFATYKQFSNRQFEQFLDGRLAQKMAHCSATEFSRHLLSSELVSVPRNAVLYAGWPKKVSHYQESSLKRIKNRQCGYISHQF